jgi:1-deoxy-D-xylulose-5-phosphate reductoisomerase
VKSVAILGATGSVGMQALEVVRDNPELGVCALSAASSADELVRLANEHGVRRIALSDPEAAKVAAASFEGEVLAGPDGVVELAGCGADVVLNAIVGAAGLDATMAALTAGSDLALANKESLVAGGDLVTEAARRAERSILPVDSEHSAIAQCLQGVEPEQLRAIVVTASGGPFRSMSAADLRGVTPAQALAHPTWQMGPKITVDSATLMNKGLELIEAHHLFGVGFDRLEVVVHPQSIVHAMVRLRDGALLAHLGHPDMRVPISFALTHPERAETPVPTLDFSQPMTLEFESPDTQVFRCLALARAAGEEGGLGPCTLNAANEVAVAAFLEGRIGFLEIAEVVERVLEQTPSEPLVELAQVHAADGAARARARESLEAVASTS